MPRGWGQDHQPCTSHPLPLGQVSPGHGDVPAACRSLLEAPLQAENYRQKFQLLLHLEEIQMEVDIRRYDMQDVPMVQDRTMLVLDVRRGSRGGGRGAGFSGVPGITPAVRHRCPAWLRTARPC